MLEEKAGAEGRADISLKNSWCMHCTITSYPLSMFDKRTRPSIASVDEVVPIIDLLTNPKRHGPTVAAKEPAERSD